MRRASARWGTLLWAVWLAVGLVTPVLAEETPPTYAEGSLRKLGRGIANIATCPGEIFRMTDIVARRDGYLAATTVGLLQGVWRTLLRGGAGVYETLTFFLEQPDDFQPLIRPEFVFAHGSWAESD